MPPAILPGKLTRTSTTVPASRGRLPRTTPGAGTLGLSPRRVRAIGKGLPKWSGGDRFIRMGFPRAVPSGPTFLTETRCGSIISKAGTVGIGVSEDYWFIRLSERWVRAWEWRAPPWARRPGRVDEVESDHGPAPA